MPHGSPTYTASRTTTATRFVANLKFDDPRRHRPRRDAYARRAAVHQDVALASLLQAFRICGAMLGTVLLVSKTDAPR
jgi:hypothetical protein